jgi:hypothetical protein
MFGNTYDPGDYSLGGTSEMSDLDIQETVPNEQLSGVFFGGLEMADE